MNKGKLLPPVYVLLSLALAFALHRFAPMATVVPRPWNLAGALLVIAGLVLIIAPAMTFKSRGTAIKPYDESTVLIQDGLYRFSRNPIYLGMVVLVLGAVVWLGTATPLIAPIVLLVVLRWVFIRVEERMLEERFGEQYRAYRNKVRRWL